MGIMQISDRDFNLEVLQSKQLVLVDFWAPWCSSCRMLGLILEELAKRYNDRLKICKVNIDEHKAAATEHQILSLPTLLFFKDGKIVDQLVGARAASDIKNAVDSLLALRK